MDNIPETIPFSSVILGERGRSQYHGIDELAESIATHGLIQPLVLERYAMPPTDGLTEGVSEAFILRAGGRRFRALERLGVASLFHATSAEPSRPGFLVAGIAADEFRGLMIEISENHNRSDIDWRDDVRLIVKAFRLWQRTKHANGERGIMLEFGSIIGVPHADLKWAVALHDDFVADPDAYREANGISPAYKVFLLREANDINKVAAERSFSRIPAFVKGEAQPTREPSTPVEGETPEPAVIPLSTQLHRGNGLDYMASLPDLCIDHVITDPDYAIDLSLLEGRPGNSVPDSEGVAQSQSGDSLGDLFRFLAEAFRVTKGFCIFWYDLSHHEKIQAEALRLGWRVQRWPVIWVKTGLRCQNGAGHHNFTKQFETAMVLRKPGTTLAQAQHYCVFNYDGMETVQKFGHPFAKPLALWRWLYSAVAIKGQVVLDPFAGRGTAPIAALQFGLRPIACEIQDAHFNDLVLNMQGAYRGVLGPNIKFV